MSTLVPCPRGGIRGGCHADRHFEHEPALAACKAITRGADVIVLPSVKPIAHPVDPLREQFDSLDYLPFAGADLTFDDDAGYLASNDFGETTAVVRSADFVVDEDLALRIDVEMTVEQAGRGDVGLGRTTAIYAIGRDGSELPVHTQYDELFTASRDYLYSSETEAAEALEAAIHDDALLAAGVDAAAATARQAYVRRRAAAAEQRRNPATSSSRRTA